MPGKRAKIGCFGPLREAKANDLRLVADDGALLLASLDDPNIMLANLFAVVSLIKFSQFTDQ